VARNKEAKNMNRLYGTGATVYGGHDLLNWDSIHNVTLESLATGIEEEAVQGLLVPPGGPPLLSVVGDDGGFYQ
jgi:xyloglucan-specific exo-beta-1,4-glucanase